jgi:hypothetical protein
VRTADFAKEIKEDCFQNERQVSVPQGDLQCPSRRQASWTCRTEPIQTLFFALLKNFEVPLEIHMIAPAHWVPFRLERLLASEGLAALQPA